MGVGGNIIDVPVIDGARAMSEKLESASVWV